MTTVTLSGVARWMLHWRARRLPPPLAERLLEEWLAEANQLARAPQLAFALGVLLTRTSTLERADAGEDRLREEAIISVDDVLVPATEQPILIASFLIDLVWIAPIALLTWTVIDLPRPYYPFELLIFIAIVAIVDGVQVALQGGSVGQRVMKLRLVSIGGGPPRVRQLVVRAAWILAFPTAFSLMFMLGVPVMLCFGPSLAFRVWMGESVSIYSLSGTMIIYVVPRVVAPRDQ